MILPCDGGVINCGHIVMYWCVVDCYFKARYPLPFPLYSLVLVLYSIVVGVIPIALFVAPTTPTPLY